MKEHPSATVTNQTRLATLPRARSQFATFTSAAFSAWRRSPRAGTWAAVVAGVVLALIIIAWPSASNRVEQPAAARPRVKRAAHRKAETRPSATAAMHRTEKKAVANEVVAAAAQTAPIVQARPEPENVVNLSADGPKLDFAKLSAGQTVRGDPERRPLIEAPSDGLVIEATGITFVNVDFAARQPLSPGASLLTLHGSKAAFHGCSFQASGKMSPSEAPAAIAWDRGVDPAVANADLSTGELEIRDSTFHRVAAAVDCRAVGGMSLRLENVLFLGAAPVVRVDRFPEGGEFLDLALSRLTLRGAKAMLEVGCDRLPASPGRLQIEAIDCAFTLPSAAALVVFQGESRPGPLLKGLGWTGERSILSPHSRLSLWRMPNGRMLAAADETVPIKGVDRQEVSFAGAMEDGPAASRIVRWQASPHSSQPPGIDDSLLRLPDID